MFEKLIKESLVWFPEKGIGYYPVINQNYDNKYFDNYKQYVATEMGKAITDARVNIVQKYYDGSVIDIGIGCGDFIEKHGYSYGYDINQTAIKWLKEKKLYKDVYSDTFDCGTFWDSLEHIKKLDKIVSKFKKFVFVSIPIFTNEHDIINSRHFKKNEHYWYFTNHGITKWFNGQGFDCVENNTMETDIGRDGIGTFVFRRRNA